MKQIAANVFFLCFSLFGYAQGNGSFNSIEGSGSLTLIIQAADSSSVQIICDDKEDAEKIRYSVSDGILKVTGSGKENDCKVKVTVKDLRKVEATGAVVIRSDGTLSVSDLDLIASGASKIKLKLNASGTVKANVNGASDIYLSGTGNQLTADLIGASGLKAGEFEVKDANLNVSGSASAKVMPRNTLNVDASGASSVRYTVQPKTVNANVTGASDVKMSGEQGMHSNDSNEVGFHGHKFKYKPKQNFHHWSGFDLGASAYSDEQFGFGISDTNRNFDLTYGRSIHAGLNIGEHDFHLYKNFVNLVTGLGFEWNSYAFRNPVTLYPDSTFTAMAVDSGMEYKRNKLRSWGLTVPLLLEFNTHKKNSRSFHLAAGLTFQYIIHSKVLKEYEMNGYDVSVNRSDDYNINPFRYSATVRAGYGDVTLFANYALSEFFENGKGPELYPFSIGVRLIPF